MRLAILSGRVASKITRHVNNNKTFTDRNGNQHSLTIYKFKMACPDSRGNDDAQHGGFLFVTIFNHDGFMKYVAQGTAIAGIGEIGETSNKNQDGSYTNYTDIVLEQPHFSVGMTKGQNQKYLNKAQNNGGAIQNGNNGNGNNQPVTTGNANNNNNGGSQPAKDPFANANNNNSGNANGNNANNGSSNEPKNPFDNPATGGNNNNNNGGSANNGSANGSNANGSNNANGNANSGNNNNGNSNNNNNSGNNNKDKNGNKIDISDDDLPF